MKTTVPALASLLLLLPVAAGAQMEQPPLLSLSDAVLEALQHNDRIANQLDGIAHAELSLRLARTAFRPHFTPNILGSFGQTNVNSQTYRVDLTQKFLTGAIALHQAADDYLDDAQEAKGLRSSNLAPSDGTTRWTTLEHQWDEAFQPPIGIAYMVCGE